MIVDGDLGGSVDRRAGWQAAAGCAGRCSQRAHQLVEVDVVIEVDSHPADQMIVLSKPDLDRHRAAIQHLLHGGRGLRVLAQPVQACD